MPALRFTESDPMLGQRAGRHVLTGTLGAGGMGRVYLAEDDRGSRVAVKTVLPELARSAPILERFALEARVSAALAHPRVVEVIDTGRFAHGAPWLMMELLIGGDVRARVRRDGPLPLDYALVILAQACEGLDAAHRAGVVHRDLKPDHVFVQDSGAVTLLDLGVAQVDDPSLSCGRDREVVGSIGTMAPEQAQGGAVDRRADVFALGVVAYWMLTGAQPFAGDTIDAYLEAVHRGAPDPRLLRPDVPAPWAAVIARALRFDRDERPPTAGDVARAMISGVTLGVSIVRAVAPSLLEDLRERPTDKMPAQPRRHSKAE